jgi:hypothetical protein
MIDDDYYVLVYRFLISHFLCVAPSDTIPLLSPYSCFETVAYKTVTFGPLKATNTAPKLLLVGSEYRNRSSRREATRMTVKSEALNPPPSAPPHSSNVEAEVVVPGQAFGGAGNSDAIPFVTAIPIDDSTPPSYNPSYGVTVQHNAYVTAAPPGGSAPPTAVVGATSFSAGNAVAASPGAVAMGGGPATTPAAMVVIPPPGLPPGGRWVRVQGAGGNTFTICCIVSVFTCIFTLLPCGLWAYLCPCDERRAYLVNGKLFDEDGGMIGSAHSRRYR